MILLLCVVLLLLFFSVTFTLAIAYVLRAVLVAGDETSRSRGKSAWLTVEWPLHVACSCDAPPLVWDLHTCTGRQVDRRQVNEKRDLLFLQITCHLFVKHKGSGFTREGLERPRWLGTKCCTGCNCDLSVAGCFLLSLNGSFQQFPGAGWSAQKSPPSGAFAAWSNTANRQAKWIHHSHMKLVSRAKWWDKWVDDEQLKLKRQRKVTRRARLLRTLAQRSRWGRRRRRSRKRRTSCVWAYIWCNIVWQALWSLS